MIEVYKIRISLAVIATLIAIDFAILSYIFQEHASILLTIEIILLPSTYIIGNYYIEELLKKQYEETISKIEDQAEKLKESYLKEKYINKSLIKK